MRLSTRWTVLYFVLLALFIWAGPARPQQPQVAIREASSEALKIGIIEERLRGMETAHTVETQELHRRLDELNHHREQADKDKVDFVNQAAFQAYQKDIQSWRDGVNQQLTSIISNNNGASSLRENWITNILALIAIAGFVYTVLTRRKESKPE